MVTYVTHREGMARIPDRLLDKFIGYLPGRVLVEYRVHEGDFSCTPPCLGFCRTVLEASEATS